MLTLDRTRYVPAGATLVKDKQSDAVAYLYANANGAYVLAVVYCGKRTKPDWHFRFKNEERREKAVREYFEARRATLQRKVDAAAAVKAKRAAGHGLQVGQVLVTSWGYDQTNIDWYQVTELVGSSSVKIRQIRGINTRDTGWATGECVPDIDNFKGPEMVKRPDEYGAVKIASYAYARVWDGRPRSWTAYA